MQAINKLILGTVQFGLDYGINNTTGKPDQRSVNEIFQYAYQSGIRYLDTAEAYGNAHEVIGQFHLAYPTNKFNIITKLPHQLDGDIQQKLDIYLQQLNVKKINALLFHSYQMYKQNKHLMAVLSRCKEDGKVGYLGVSIYNNEQFEDVIEDENVDIIQLPFNLFDNINKRGMLLQRAKNRGKILHSRSAFLQGLFFVDAHSKNKIATALSSELKYINDLANKYEMSLQNMALNYCIQQKDIDNVLIGVDNITQLKQNLTIAENILPEKLVDEINNINIKNTNLLNPSLWAL